MQAMMVHCDAAATPSRCAVAYKNLPRSPTLQDKQIKAATPEAESELSGAELV
jgi:hypothetical protein